jgi:NIMA (never in mitosis gene a)-related kinase 1/4/5
VIHKTEKKKYIAK